MVLWLSDYRYHSMTQSSVVKLGYVVLESTLTLHYGAPCAHWTQEKLQKSVIGQHLTVSVNPEQKIDNLNDVIQFTTYLSCFVKVS